MRQTSYPKPFDKISLTLRGHSVESKEKDTIKDALKLRETEEHKKIGLLDKTSKVFIVTYGLFLAGFLFLGYVYFKDKAQNQTKNKEISEARFEPTYTPELNLSEYDIRILNGSGIPGEAKKVADILKTKGFINIDIGDADTYDFQETEVSLKDDVASELFEILKSTLPTFSLKKTESLKDSSYDVLIIVGPPIF